MLVRRVDPRLFDRGLRFPWKNKNKAGLAAKILFNHIITTARCGYHDFNLQTGGLVLPIMAYTESPPPPPTHPRKGYRRFQASCI